MLAIIQGLTEFLPVSSSAHLIFPSQLLGWEDQGLAFDVAVHVGTLLAVVCYYIADLVKIGTYTLEAMIKLKQTPISRIGCCLIVASIPVCIAGFFFMNEVETIARSVEVIAYATIGFGILLGLASYVNRHLVWRTILTVQGERADTLRHMTVQQAFVIGCAQVLALIPGTSRSGITITAGLLLGMRPEAAARFSFLLAIPVIIASGTLETIACFNDPIHWGSVNITQMVIGALTAFFVALAVIHLFIKYIAKSGMAVFVTYRIVLGIILLWLF